MDVKQATHIFSLLIFTGMNQNKDWRLTGDEPVNPTLILVCDACNIKLLHFIHLPCVRLTYSDATKVLYTARLVNRAFRIQLIVK